MCVCVCLYVTMPQANVLPAGLRSEVMTCLLCIYTWGRRVQEKWTQTRTLVSFIFMYIDIINWYVFCASSQMGSKTLEVQPWAADGPSFTAELDRIIAYVTRPQVGSPEHHLNNSSAFNV